METKTLIGIIGAGTMGRGIAQLAAENDHSVLLFDTNSGILSRSKELIKEILQKKVDNEKITSVEKNKIMDNIILCDSLSEMNTCRLVIEAAIENMYVKKNVFADLSNVVHEECILATNTSSLSITSIASAAKRPERVIGIHFFNPAPVMLLVEIIPGLLTSESTITCAQDIIHRWNKTIVIAKDSPGFIVNRIARPFYGEALRILEEEIADVATIDWAVKEFGQFKMGPFELMDLIGIDVNLSVTKSIFEATYFNQRYKPSYIQQQMVDANLLGRKTGKGFYDYSGKENPVPNKNLKSGQEILNRILLMLINEAADAVLFKLASVKDIDVAITKGVNYPKGLLKWADEIGIDFVLSGIDKLFNEYGEERYKPGALLKRMAKEGKTFNQ